MNGEAKEEAEFFASVIAGKNTDCKLAMDFEEFNGLGTYEINIVAETFLDTLKNLTGKELIVYSDLYNAQNTFSINIAKKYGLWIAFYGNYNNLRNYETSWTYWTGVQYEDNGYIDGINGYVDRDLFTKDIFISDRDKTIPLSNKTYTIETRTILYTVKKNNTLWQIARQYGTTVKEIAGINNIKNVNLIYPGEVLKIIENSNVYGSISKNLGSTIYVVKSGDCLYSIANKFGVTISQLIRLNNILNPNLIFPGEKIKIK